MSFFDSCNRAGARFESHGGALVVADDGVDRSEGGGSIWFGSRTVKFPWTFTRDFCSVGFLFLRGRASCEVPALKKFFSCNL